MCTLHEDQSTFEIMITDHVNSPQNEKCFRNKLYNQNTFYFQRLFFQLSCCLRDNVEKCGTERQATDGNMAHVHCLLYN